MIFDQSPGMVGQNLAVDLPTIFIQEMPLPKNPDLFQIDCLTGVDSGPTVIGLDAAIQTDNCGCDV